MGSSKVKDLEKRLVAKKKENKIKRFGYWKAEMGRSLDQGFLPGKDHKNQRRSSENGSG